MITVVFGKDTIIGKELEKLHKGKYNIIFPEEKEVDPRDNISFLNYMTRNPSISKIIYLYDSDADSFGYKTNPKAKQKCIENNIIGVENVAKYSRTKDIRVCLLSSYKVYNGGDTLEKINPKQEDSQSEYVKQKIAAEEMVRTTKSFIIIRVGDIFGDGDKFLTTIKSKVDESIEEIKADFDRFISPVYAKDAAFYLSSIIINRNSSDGVYNISNSGFCTPWKFAKEVVKIMGKEDVTKVIPVESGDVSYEISLQRLYDARTQVRSWRSALKDYFENK